MSAKVLAFPVQCACPTCQKPCGEDELSQCLRCGAQYCPNPACWMCECDRFAAEIVQRAEDAKYRLTGKPIEEPAEENTLAEQFILEQFGEVTCE